MIWTDRTISFLLILGCGLLWPLTERFPGSSSDFPQLILILIAALSAILVLRSFVVPPARIPLREGDPGFAPLVRPLAVFAALTGAVLSMRVVGFYGAVAGLGVALMLILGVRNRAAFVLSYLGLIAFAYGFFELLLGVPLSNQRLWGG